MNDREFSYLKARLTRLEPDLSWAMQDLAQAEIIIIVSLFSLNCELAKIPLFASQNELALARFKWWQDEIMQLFTKAPASKKVPLLAALAFLIDAKQLEAEPCQAFLTAKLEAFQQPPFIQQKLLDAYLLRSNGQLFKLVAKALGSLDEPLDQLALLYKKLHLLTSLNYRNYNQHPFISQERKAMLKDQKSTVKQLKIAQLELNDCAVLLQQLALSQPRHRFWRNYLKLLRFRLKP